MKSLLTAHELIEHMEEKGITFNYETKESAEQFLISNNYYLKLASYRSNYNKRPDGMYINLDFSYLKELSTIDMHIRHLVIQMALDIEHFLKVALLADIEKNDQEDGYKIIQKFLAKDVTFNMLKTIQKHKASDYCKELIEKYYPFFPAWVFVELISFGDLAYLCEFYNQTYGANVGDRILLNSVRDIRNAAAHSNCLINVLATGNNKPHQTVVDRVKNVKTISEVTRDKKLKNKCLYDFVCLLYAYDEIVSSIPMKKKLYLDLQELFDNRMLRHKDWFVKNNLITSSYQFSKKILDSVGSSW